MRINYLQVFLFLTLISCTNIFAQRRCLTDEYNNALDKNNPERKFAKLQKKNSYNKEFLTKNYNKTVIIPVVFHIIHNGESVGTSQNPSEDKILEQIQILNDIYSNKNNKGVDTNIKFCLAKQNSFGLSTSGIFRYRGYQNSFTISDDRDETFIGDDRTLKISYRNSNISSVNYLNVWVANVNLINNEGNYEDLPGYSSFPWEVDLNLDGIVLNYKNLGLNSAVPGFDLGKTLAHEAGHWLGLYHTFETFQSSEPNNCNLENDCSQEGDQVCDTEKRPGSFLDIGKDFYGNDLTLTNCSTAVPCDQFGDLNVVQNYMDYNYDQCYTFFTQGQKERMKEQLSRFRTLIYLSDKPIACDATSDNGESSSITPCNSCYEPFLYNPFNQYSYTEQHNLIGVKNNLYIDVEAVPSNNGLWETFSISVHERTGCENYELKKTFTYDGRYSWGRTSDIKEIIIIDDNTFAVHFFQFNLPGSDKHNLLIFKKKNNIWYKTGEAHIENHSRTIYERWSDTPFFIYESGLFFRRLVGRSFKIYKVDTNNSSYSLYKSYDKVIDGGPYNKNGNLFINEGDGYFNLYSWTDKAAYHRLNFLGRVMYNTSAKNIFINKEIIFKGNILIVRLETGEILLFKRNNREWILYQDLTSLINASKLYRVGLEAIINSKFIVLKKGSSIYFLKDTGAKFEIIDLTHINGFSGTINYLCSRNFNINYQRNEIVLDNITLKMSDIIGEGISTDICSIPLESTVHGYNITIGGVNCAINFQNMNKTFIAENEIIIKPGVIINSGNVIAKISDVASSDCTFTELCNSSSRAINNKSNFYETGYENIKNESIDKSIKIYPNPNNGTFYIDNIKGVEKLELYNMMGQLILNKKINSNNNIVIPNIKNGLYNLILYRKNGTKESTKFIINK